MAGISGGPFDSGNGIIENTYNVGKITANEESNSGGIIGLGKIVRNSYNFGTINVPTGKNYVGSIAGYLYDGDISTCYYLTSTYNVGVGYGTYSVNSEDDINTLKQTLNQSFSSIAGWKLDTSNDNDGYPMLDF